MSALIGMDIKAVIHEPSLVIIPRHWRFQNVLSEVLKDQVLLQVVLRTFFSPVLTFSLFSIRLVVRSLEECSGLMC